MPPPSFQHRHLLLSAQLDSSQYAAPPPDAFAVQGQVNERGCKLDAILLAGWAAGNRKSKQADKDVLQHVDNLRIKKGDFDVLGRIGEGQFGVVDAVKCKLDGKVYAMKTIEKSTAMRAGPQLGLGTERYIHSLALPPAPVPQLVACFQSASALHMVTAYAACGSLWDRMCEMIPVPGLDTGRMQEGEVAWWARQMVSCITWLHGMGFAHRDIKPHNFLLLPDARLWLTDFGSSAPLTDGMVPKGLCAMPAGTPDYVAPEVLRLAEDAVIRAARSMDECESEADRTNDGDQPGYGREVDWWSLGATLYEMSVGRAPFWAPSIGATYEKIMRCDVRMPEHLSTQLRSLLSGLLSPADVRLGHVDPGEIRRHHFFSGIEWTRLPPAPGCVPLPQAIDLDTLADSFQHNFDDLDEMTFEHFFNNTTAGFNQSISMSMSMSVSSAAVPPAAYDRWIGWSWDPHPHFFGIEPPPALSPPNRPFSLHPSPATNLNMPFTPLRTGIRQVTPASCPRSAPRSVPRTRPVSERQAFAELVKCVQASARKKIISSAKVIPGSVSSISSTNSQPVWKKEQPPTPTPMSRDVTTLISAMRGGTKQDNNLSVPEEFAHRRFSRTLTWSAGDDSVVLSRRAGTESSVRGPSRPSSRASGRSRDNTLLSRLSAVSNPAASTGPGADSTSTASGPLQPSRTFTRATSLPLRKMGSRESITKPRPLSDMPPISSHARRASLTAPISAASNTGPTATVGAGMIAGGPGGVGATRSAATPADSATPSFTSNVIVSKPDFVSRLEASRGPGETQTHVHVERLDRSAGRDASLSASQESLASSRSRSTPKVVLLDSPRRTQRYDHAQAQDAWDGCVNGHARANSHDATDANGRHANSHHSNSHRANSHSRSNSGHPNGHTHPNTHHANSNTHHANSNTRSPTYTHAASNTHARTHTHPRNHQSRDYHASNTRRNDKTSQENHPPRFPTQPTHTGTGSGVGSGIDKLDAMAEWHRSLESGLANLERRLMELTVSMRVND